MATEIVPSTNTLPGDCGAALQPLFAPLANSSTASADAATAALYCRNEGGLRRGGFSYESYDATLFWFTRDDGAVDWFTAGELRNQTWWYWLPEQIALSIEANLFPTSQRDLPVSYVARAAAGGKLILHSRLSDYFHGDRGRDQAYEERDRLQSATSDAAVFLAESVEEAELLLSSDGASFALTRRRMAEARAARFAEGAAAKLSPAVS